MSDSVSTQVLENGNQNYVAKFTNLSDGTGETAVVKLNPTSSGDMGVIIAGQAFYPGTHMKIWKVEYNVTNMLLQVQWVATSPVDLWLLSGFGKHSFQDTGGLFVPQSAGAPVTGATGAVTFTTRGAGAGASYTLTIWAKKAIHQ